MRPFYYLFCCFFLFWGFFLEKGRLLEVKNKRKQGRNGCLTLSGLSRWKHCKLSWKNRPSFLESKLKGSWRIDGFSLRKYKFITKEIRTEPKSLRKSECPRKLYLTDLKFFLSGLKDNGPVLLQHSIMALTGPLNKLSLSDTSASTFVGIPARPGMLLILFLRNQGLVFHMLSVGHFGALA